MQKGAEPDIMTERWHGTAHSSCFYKGSAVLDETMPCCVGPPKMTGHEGELWENVVTGEGNAKPIH